MYHVIPQICVSVYVHVCMLCYIEDAVSVIAIRLLIRSTRLEPWRDFVETVSDPKSASMKCDEVLHYHIIHIYSNMFSTVWGSPVKAFFVGTNGNVQLLARLRVNR